MSSEAATYFPESLSRLPDERQTVDPAPEFIAGPIPNSDAVNINDTDEWLLFQVGKGSRDALGLLFRRYGRPVLNTAWRILRDRFEADDLRQEVFLYVFRNAKQFDPQKGSTASWIIQITYHRAIDRRRYLNSRQHYSIQELDEERLADRLGQPSTDTIDGGAILSRLRDQLSAEQTKTLELHFFEGHSFREIAEQSGQSVGNVRHHYYRALERLRANLFPKKRV